MRSQKLAGKFGARVGPSSRRYARPGGRGRCRQISTAGPCPLNLLRNSSPKHERRLRLSAARAWPQSCRCCRGAAAGRPAVPPPRCWQIGRAFTGVLRKIFARGHLAGIFGGQIPGPGPKAGRCAPIPRLMMLQPCRQAPRRGAAARAPHTLQGGAQRPRRSPRGVASSPRRPSLIGSAYLRSRSQGKKIQVSCDTSVMKVSHIGAPWGLA